MALILDGKEARAYYTEKLKSRVKKLSIKPSLAIIQIGNREESSAYIRSKIKFGEEIGVRVKHVIFEESIKKGIVLNEINNLNKDKKIHGIIVQLPIPSSLDKQEIVDAIEPEKDTDGLTSVIKERRQVGNIYAPFPATARGVTELLEFYKIEVKDKKVAVLGRSILAGGPIKEAIEKTGGKVTVCHSKTPLEDEKRITKESDIIIVAIGKPKFLTNDFFTRGANQVVVDVGINKVTDVGIKKMKEEVAKNKFVGDVDFEGVFPLVYAISPVPGGVGQMTVLALFENLIDCLDAGKSLP